MRNRSYVIIESLTIGDLEDSSYQQLRFHRENLMDALGILNEEIDEKIDKKMFLLDHLAQIAKEVEA